MELLYAAFGYLVLCISTCGTQAASYQGRYLTYSSTGVSWNTAYATCSKSGGHLLTVDNNITINALNYIRAQPVAAAISTDIWMGLHNADTTSDVPVYVWADCNHLDDNTAIWYPGEPNYVKIHRCIIASLEYEWKTRDCTETHPFFCEYALKSDCTFETADGQTCEMGGVLLRSEMENDACATRCQEDMDGSDICWAYEYNTQSKQCKLLFGSDPYMCETLQANMGFVTGRRRCFKFSDITGSEVKGEDFPTCNKIEVTASQTTSITTTSDNTPYISTTNVAATRYTLTMASATQDTTTTSPSLETTTAPTTSTTTSTPTTSDTASTPETTRDTTMTSPSLETTTTTATTTTSAPTTSDTASTPETTRDTPMTSPSLETTTTTTTTTTTSAPTTSDTTSTPETTRDTTMTSTTFEASATSAASTPDTTATAETLETTFSAPDKTTTTSSPLDDKVTSQATTTDTIIASTASTATTATRDTDTPTSTIDTSTAASSSNSTGAAYTPSLTTYLSRLDAALASSTSASSPAVASLGRHVYEVCVSVQTFTAAERKKRTDDLVDDLSLDKKNLSSYRRKKSSAEDERPSAQHVGGGVAIMLLVTAALVIILPDCTSILMHAVHGFKKKHLVAAQQ
ncbi:uncharacterized protein [Haliotis cracherodii]|uniref:uncharacterized protein n=1 Tax=Haliotis cracherodii TaxID=6455 RepID=UPI0039ED31A6